VWAAIRICPRAANRRCPVTAISSRGVLATRSATHLPERPLPAPRGDADVDMSARSGTAGARHASPRAVAPLRSDVPHCLVVVRNSTWPTLVDRRRLDAEGDGVADVTHLGDVSAVVRLQRVVSWRT
jgi:hypothetical protein